MGNLLAEQEKSSKRKITAGQVARYALLPGIVPRLKELFGSGFGNLAMLMASVFSAVRLLPPNHPYLQSENFGKFGIRHVLIEAASRLKFDRHHIDQVIVFFTIVTGFLLLVIQTALMLLMLLTGSAKADVGDAAKMAAGLDLNNGYSKTAETQDYDIALNMLARVFGIPKFFCTKSTSTGITGAGTTTSECYNGEGQVSSAAGEYSAFHRGLYSLFGFYNRVIQIIGLVIFLYYILIVVGETAQTGTPFGKRFNHIWAPLRLVFAIGLLLPIGPDSGSKGEVTSGFTLAQYIVLQAAKSGSNFGSQAWREYNENITRIGNNKSDVPNPMGASGQTMFVHPQYSSALAADMVEYMAMVHSCRIAYELMYPDMKIEAYMVRGEDPAGSLYHLKVDSAAMGDPTASPISSWNAARQFFRDASGRQGDVTVIFGDRPAGSGYANETGGVMNRCGAVRFYTAAGDNEGIEMIQGGYFKWVMSVLWNSNLFDLRGGSKPDAQAPLGQVALRMNCLQNNIAHLVDNKAQNSTAADLARDGRCADTPFGDGDAYDQWPKVDWWQAMSQKYLVDLNTILDINKARQKYMEAIAGNAKGEWQSLMNRGWGGAGIWYNRMAQWNGKLVSIASGLPESGGKPAVSIELDKARRAVEESSTPGDNYKCSVVGGDKVGLEPKDMSIALTICSVNDYLSKAVVSASPAADNLLTELIHKTFGTAGLERIRHDSSVHPLAKLSGLGRGLMDAAIRNMTFALGGAVGEGYINMRGANAKKLEVFLGRGASMGGGILKIFTTTTLSMGFGLYYVLPMLPFLYFFFAVSSWAKAVFEAMVGAPLWALAHMRIDGNGLPGDHAMQGYYLILEIFLRPIMTIISLLAAMTIYTALIRTLDSVFDLTVQNMTGFDHSSSNISILSLPGTSFNFSMSRGNIDKFFYLIVFTILSYTMGVTSFKLIDKIPDRIMRWMGTNVKTFGDIDKDQVGEFSQRVDMGVKNIGYATLNATYDGAKAVGSMGGSAMNRFFNRDGSSKAKVEGDKD